MSRRDLSEYYAGFANSVLWPLCHYRLDLTDYARKDMAGYFRVNRFFVERLLPLIRPDDLIWIHDYHLIPMASELRRLGVENRIGFFMHIPWPSPDVFFTLPVHETIISNLTAYGVVGFQTTHDAENFASGLRREGIGTDGGGGWLETYGRRFQAGAARELDGAILVRPYDIDAVGNAIAQALSMPIDERRARLIALIGLHVLAVVFHHLLLKSSILKRMF